MSTTQEQLALARSAKKSINTANTALKNQALEAMASQLLKATEVILAANQIDMEAARGKISEVMLDRLFLDQERIAGMAQGIRALIDLPDPIGEVLDTEVLENGLEIQKVRVAMGVIGIIYESRPNVTSDAAALAIKSGNAVVLRTGKDAFHSAQAIVTALKAGLEEELGSSMSMWIRRLISRKPSPLLKMLRQVVHPSAMPWRSCWWIERSRLTSCPWSKSV